MRNSNERIELSQIQLRLRDAIKTSGLQQKDIAKEIDVSPQTVSKYMTTNVFPALDTFGRLCKLLDVNANYILGISNE